jgi:phosphoglycolate phosphatase
VARVAFGSTVRSVTVVAFDKDGTLLASAPLWRELHRLRCSLMEPLAGPDGVAAYSALMGVIGGEVHRTGPLAVGTEAEESTMIAAILYRFTGRHFHECRSKAEEIVAQTNQQLDLARAVHPLPGMPDVLFRLKTAGVRVGIATSDTAERTCRSLALAGVPEEAIDFVITPTDVARGKPEPDMLRLIARRFGARPEEMAMVGDSPVDMIMARRHGSIAVGIPEAASERAVLAPLADTLLSSLSDIVAAE